jgi:heme-degrading monooxygenase HmoA
MYAIIWEYYVKAERLSEFEKIYGASGVWVELFQKQNGFIGTELLHDRQKQERYITVDRWVSSADYELFLSQWKKEYDSLDAQCGGLIEQEMLLGQWESIDHETR